LIRGHLLKVKNNNDDPEQGFMNELTFRPSSFHDLSIFQQMVQGTELSCMSFNTHGKNFYSAEHHRNPVGFIAGHKGYGDESHVLTIDGLYLYSAYHTDENRDSMLAHFARDMQSKLGVTHIRTDFLSAPEAINVQNLKLVHSVPDVPLEEAATPSYVYELHAA